MSLSIVFFYLDLVSFLNFFSTLFCILQYYTEVVRDVKCQHTKYKDSSTSPSLQADFSYNL